MIGDGMGSVVQEQGMAAGVDGARGGRLGKTS